MKFIYRLIVLGGAAFMLNGCQSSPLTSWMFKSANSAQVQRAQTDVDTATALEEGRYYLRRGSLAAAAASFQVAQLEPQYRPEAINGLAVVYAQLGRLDLADRYFQEAISLEPENPRYVANLLRLQHQVIFARQQAARPTQLAQASGTEDAVLPRDALANGTVERISRNEVLVRSRSQTAAPPAMTVAARHPRGAVSDGIADAADPDRKNEQFAERQPLTVTFVE